MVQVGTVKFDAEKFCLPTTVTLMGSTLPKDAPKALSSYTDGYKMMVEMTFAQGLTASQEAGLCIMGDKAGNPICAGVKIGEEDGQIKAAMAFAYPRAMAG
jgi:hypothetical protein